MEGEKGAVPKKSYNLVKRVAVAVVLPLNTAGRCAATSAARASAASATSAASAACLGMARAALCSADEARQKKTRHYNTK